MSAKVAASFDFQVPSRGQTTSPKAAEDNTRKRIVDINAFIILFTANGLELRRAVSTSQPVVFIREPALIHASDSGEWLARGPFQFKNSITKKRYRKETTNQHRGPGSYRYDPSRLSSFLTQGIRIMEASSVSGLTANKAQTLNKKLLR